MPRQPFEREGCDRLKRRKVVSRRHSLKTMFIGVVTDPVEQNGFDGKIYLERIADNSPLVRTSYREEFHHDRFINDLLKSGDWRQLDPNDPSCPAADLIELIAETYEIDEDQEDYLCLRYSTFTENGVKKIVTLGNGESILEGKTLREEDGTVRVLTLADLNLFKMRPAGTEVVKDVNCDSEFMLRVMPSIGEAYRQKMRNIGVPDNELVYLVMDNAGGHGTDDAIDEYTRTLRDEHNIEIIHQAARSPETNALDLGLWMSIQSSVEKKQFTKTTASDVLAATVQEAWRDLPAATIRKVFERIPKVLDIIIDDQGRNDRVETRRGERVVIPGEGIQEEE